MKKETIKTAMWLVAAATINISSITKAQNVGINASGVAPDNSAMLDVDVSSLPNNNKKGLLIPRVALTSNTDVTTIPSPANSLVVYNTNASMTNGNGAGFYYWDAGAGKWIYMASPANGPGNTGQVLTSQGAGNPPQWSTLSVSGGGGPTGCANCMSMISPASSSTMEWWQCANYCLSGTWGGYNDWRMPTWDEAIMYRTSAAINKTLSSGWASNYVWTSTPWDARVNSTASAGGWVVFNESTGDWGGNNYYNDIYCRCVR